MMASEAAEHINFTQVRKIIKTFDEWQKLTLLQDLEKETWSTRFKELLADIRKQATKQPISEEEILRACEEVREEHYDRDVREGRR